MKYICKADKNLSEKEIEYLKKNLCEIEYIAKLGKYYIINSDSQKRIINTGLFETVRESATCNLADVTLFPQIANKPLTKKGYVGWKVKVAVLDSGVKECDSINITYKKDYTGYSGHIVNNHGTQVAKIIKHFAPGVSFLSLKVAHDYDFQEANIIPALDDAMDKEANIINLSFGISRKCGEDCTLCSYINLIVEAGFIVTVASGNQGENGDDSVTCPGRAEKAITVGQIDKTGAVAKHSGKGTVSLLKPNIIATGNANVKIEKTVEVVEGTSFSTPVISGVLASVFHLQYDRETLITKLYDSTKRIKTAPSHHQGFGVFDLKKFLEVCDHGENLSNNG